MRAETRDRRQMTWRYLRIDGMPETEVISTVADEYDVTESTVSEDIRNMEDWLPEINRSAREAELSLVYELEETRRRLYEMAEEAKETTDLTTELKIRRAIIETIKLDGRLSEDINRNPIEENTDDLVDMILKEDDFKY